MDLKENSLVWAREKCLGTQSPNPGELLEELMANPKCAAFGPAHHFLVGAALTTSLDRAKDEGGAKLEADLEELFARSLQLPGAACAKWGICAAAISAGMAYSIAAGTAPLKREGWSEGQAMVASITAQIAQAGAPRCCKRDARIAVEHATEVFTRDFGVAFPPVKGPRKACAVADQNTVCIGTACPYFASDSA